VKPEIEAKFLDVNQEEVREKLRELGATQDYPMRLMRRLVVQSSAMQDKGAYVRVRDEGDKVTMTLKRKEANTIDGILEAETEVADFDTTMEILRGFEPPLQSFQESKREKWRQDGVEIVLDEWPWVKPFVEIEGESELAVRAMAERLGFAWEEAVFGSIMQVYRAEYPRTGEGDKLGQLEAVRFSDPLPDIFQR
jgi:adenylate cyclase class 2